MRSLLFGIAIATMGSGLANAQCSPELREFVGSDPTSYPPFGVTNMCFQGKPIAVACGRRNLTSTNLSPATMQRVKSRQARLDAEGEIVKFAEGGDWISNEEQSEEFTNNENAGTANYFDQFNTEQQLQVKARLKAGIFMAAQHVDESQVQICVATTTESTWAAEHLGREGIGIEEVFPSLPQETEGATTSHGAAETYSWPPKDN